MEEKRNHINISAPNLVNICVDQEGNGELSGKIYHCYSENGQKFSNLMQVLRMMENLFDDINFPQSSTMSRSFFGMETGEHHKPKKCREQTEVILHRGKKNTFIVSVRFRQNSCWQGDVYWLEKEEVLDFFSTLDFIKILDRALSLN